MLFLTVKLHQQLTADGQSLIQDPVDLIVGGLRLPGQCPSRLPRLSGGQNKKRDHRDPQQRQDPVLLEHGHDRHDEGDSIGQDAPEGIYDHRLHTVDIRGHTGHDIPLVIRGIEALGHFRQVFKHLIPHIEGNMLGDPGVDVAFRHADEIRRQRDAQRRSYENDQQPHVSPDQTFVDDLTGEDRRKQSQDRRYKDRQKHQHQLQLIGFKI